MARRRKSAGGSMSSVYGARPVDRTAARGISRVQSWTSHDVVKLRKKAERITSAEKRKRYLEWADEMEKAIAAAQRRTDGRMTGPRAIERARRALEKAK
jgi:uncharacterized protein YbjT (DUF2867 family)